MNSDSFVIKQTNMKLLIVYGTTEGQTRKIAEFLALEAEKTGAEVTLCDASMEQISPDRYDAVMIGASMHMHRYQTSITHYVKEHMGTLNAIPTALFSVSLSALSEGYDAESFNELKDITMHFLVDTGWNPTATAYMAGALRYTQYDFLKKFIMRQIAKSGGSKDTDTTKDVEYTDWEKVRKFLNDFLASARVWHVSVV